MMKSFWRLDDLAQASGHAAVDHLPKERRDQPLNVLVSLTDENHMKFTLDLNFADNLFVSLPDDSLLCSQQTTQSGDWPMNKIRKIVIDGPSYDFANADRSVCPHLKTMLDVLSPGWNSGWRRLLGLTRFKRELHGPSIIMVHTNIDFRQAREYFDLPDYIKLNQPEATIGCARCWCEVQARK